MGLKIEPANGSVILYVPQVGNTEGPLAHTPSPMWLRCDPWGCLQFLVLFITWAYQCGVVKQAYNFMNMGLCMVYVCKW